MANLSQSAMDYNLIMIELTNCCNLDCEYCYRSRMNIKGKMLSEQEFQFRLGSIKRDASILFCGMGEQLTHPEIYHFLQIAKKHKIQLVTNGTIKIDTKELEKSANVQSITFSVDGADEETVQKLCSRYKFDVLLENLEQLTSQKRISKAINYVVSDKNFDQLICMADFCEEYHVEAWNLLLSTMDLKWVKENYHEIWEKFILLKEHIHKKNYHFYLNMPDTMYCHYNGVITPYISVNGYVRPCCSHDRGVKVVGNIKTNTMQEIIDGTQWRRFVAEFDCDTCSMNQAHFSF